MKHLKRIGILSLCLLVLMNIIAAFHAYKFTHFSTSAITKTNNPKDLNLIDKISTLFFGISNPKPKLHRYPNSYITTILADKYKTAIWECTRENAKGTVILFHGYSGCKSDLISNSRAFQRMGYSTILVDFMGSGETSGVQTTIGFHESEQVKSVFDFISTRDSNIILFGSSMGAVAILKAMYDSKLNATSIILECPFGSLLSTTKSRFKMMGIPSFPMAQLLAFWGGIENNFWAFDHNPVEYAKEITTPTLLMYGDKDPKVSLTEIKSIFKNIPSKKKSHLFLDVGHENYLNKKGNEWTRTVSDFLNELPPSNP